MIPLSTRMRPKKIEDFIGQEHFLYNGSLFFNSIKNNTFESAIFYGPSGTGKTTLARIISNELDSSFVEINASTTGTKELKEVLENAKLSFYGIEKKTTTLYIDEFHRWNKLQQDSLLKALEDGIIRFIGSTTENPYFSINNAILSRVKNIYEFKRHTKNDIVKIVLRAINDREIGFGNLNIKYDTSAIDMLAEFSSGDARVALDTIGFIIDNLNEGDIITKEVVSEAMQRKIGFYDKEDDKYHLLSALQKSIRGSDPDAAIHYFARLMDGGADLLMVGRRLLVMASEDIGMAYPQAISIVISCVQAAQMVGYPEGVINLSEAVILLASSPKSNRANEAFNKAIEDIRNKEIDDVPEHLINNQYKREDGEFHKKYKYPHAYGGYVKQQYLPDNLYKENVKYYEPTENGQEVSFKRYLDSLKDK